MNEAAFACTARLDQVARSQDDATDRAGSDGRVGMIDAHLGHETSASGEVGAPRAEQSNVTRDGRHFRRRRVVKNVRFFVQPYDTTPFDHGRVPQVSFAKDSVQQLARWSFDFS